MGEREGEKKGAERKTSYVKMTGTPMVVKTELKISLHIPGQLRAWKNPSLYVCTHIHALRSRVGQRNNTNNVN